MGSIDFEAKLDVPADAALDFLERYTRSEAGVEYYHAEMRVDVGSDDAVTLVWVTDYLPHELADSSAAGYAGLFAELAAAVTAHAAAT